MDLNKIQLLERALKRERAARKEAEKILEQKSAELYSANLRLEKSYTELEALLDKTDSQLQGVFENIVDAYVIMDLMGNILKMNDAAVDLLGFENTKENYNLLDFPLFEEKESVSRAFKDLLKNGSITDLEINILTKKQERKFIHVNASVIYDDGLPVAAQGIVRDITLKDKYRKSLEVEKQKYYNIISNMDLGLVEVDSENRIIMTNQSFINMTGYSKEELIGLRGNDFLPIKDDIGLSEKKLKERKKGKTDSYELRVKNKKGELRYWLVSGAPNYDLEGNLIGSIGINFDITEIKNLQIQKGKLLSQLEKSNDELQEYAHVVSHDLKSPLRSINALVSWLKSDNKDNFDKVSLQNLSLIETTIEKMDNLISDVLAYSSIGSENTEQFDVDLNILIEELIQFLYKPDHVKIHVINTLPVVMGDKIKLQQLFQNLMSNAIKFIDKEQGYVKINVEDIGTHFKFSIEDNGIGIDEKHHSNIFKVFQSVNKRKDSTGIGLSIVQKIVELHQGEIWLNSKINEGTTFFFTLKK